ncbi:MAG TPA: sigma-70 family RNA polymerase sigma factor [Noviherbaspirillum sp.]|nr:sigma-70 family RNA polymerase sigma factor [Noviherbaspirillum sp.]
MEFSPTASVSVEASADLAPLWASLVKEADPSSRERLIEFYFPFARILAGKLYAKRTYPELEFSDYLQYASIGLIEAVDRFDPERGVKFETFAAMRINGAVLNGVGSLSEKQEQVSARQRLVSERMKSLKAEETEKEDPALLFGYLAELAIGLAVGFALEDSGMYQEGNVAYPDNTYQHVELKQLHQQIRQMLEKLPGNERRVIKYHYLQQLPFEEVARILNLTKGRVSQIHKEALNRLRNGVRRTGSVDLRF